MRQTVLLKSSFRQPLRTLLLILLVGMTLFAFVSKAVEYLVVQRETGRLGSYYRSIGSLEPLNNKEYDVSHGASLIQGSPYLAYEDRRRYSSGVMPDIWNPDVLLGGMDGNGMWFYGTLINQQTIVKNDEQQSSVGYALTFVVDQVLAGFPDDIQAGSGTAISLPFIFAGHEDAIPKIEAMALGQRYLVRGWKDIFFKSDPNWYPPTSNFQLRALNDAGLWYIPVAAGAGVDFTAPGMAPIKNDIDILNENEHSWFITGTSDMSAMPEMQASSHIYYLADGRWLNHQDELEGRRVIVIQRQFADKQKLRVGDSLTMTLRGRKDPYGAYIQGKDRESWRSYPTYQETFEIVGIYDSLMGSSNSNDAYVPNSVLPAEVVDQLNLLYSSTYSFVLDSSQHQEAFINQYKDSLAKLGFSLNFVENNSATFWTSVNPLRRSALAGLLIYSLVLLIALVLSVFLYLSQRRKDYAILRALGVPKDHANRQASLPILLMGAVGVLAGGIPAWGYALEKSAESLSKLPTPAGMLPSATLNPLILSALGGGLLLLLVCFTWVGVGVLANRPVLELLGRETPAGKARATSSKTGATTAVTAMPAKPTPVETPRSATSVGHRPQRAAKGKPFSGTSTLARFGLRQVRRSAAKSSLTALVALGLVVALGWMQWSIDRNRAEVDHLYATTVVDAEIAPANPVLDSPGDGAIAELTVERVVETGFIQSAYFEAADYTTAVATQADPATLLGVAYRMTAFDQPEKYFEGLETRDTLKYLWGWDESLFTKDWTINDFNRQGVPAVFPDSFLETYNLNLGDRIYIYETTGKMVCAYLVAGQYTPGFWHLTGNIVRNINEAILLPLSALKVIQNNDVYYTIAKFVIDPARNRELPGFEQAMNTMISGSRAGRVPLKIHFWDEELRAVVAPMEKNLSLLQVLYPVTMAVSVLIGAGLCLLLALQKARDTALLLMLGVTKTRVRLLLSGEQFLLSLAGVLMGLALLGILRQNPGAVLAGPLLISAGLYLFGALIGSLIGAISVSNKKPLELLQVKE